MPSRVADVRNHDARHVKVAWVDYIVGDHHRQLHKAQNAEQNEQIPHSLQIDEGTKTKD